MNIIGISGLAGSGKDTVADYLLHNTGFVKVSLADPIKRFAMDVWEFTEEQLFGASKYRNAPDFRYRIPNPDGVLDPDVFLTPRHVLQHVGTEGARAIDGDVWIRYAIRTAQRLLEDSDFIYSQRDGLERNPAAGGETKAVIIPDVRFINEVEHIKAAGGKLLRVVRPGAGLEGNFAIHQSEAEMAAIPDSEFDRVIHNIGTLDDLKKNVQEFVTSL